MITAEQVSKERNITVRAVQKKAKKLGIEKRNGRYIFTLDELERMYGEQSRGLKYPPNEPITNHQEPGANRNERPELKNEHFNEQQIRFAKMTQSCQDKFFEVHDLMTQQRFQNEDLEEARQVLLRSMGDIMVSFESMNKNQPTCNETKEMKINLDEDNLIVE